MKMLREQGPHIVILTQSQSIKSAPIDAEEFCDTLYLKGQQVKIKYALH